MLLLGFSVVSAIATIAFGRQARGVLEERLDGGRDFELDRDDGTRARAAGDARHGLSVC